MQIKLTSIKIVFLLCGLYSAAFAQNNNQDGLCNIKNTAFHSGESFVLTVYYTIAGLYINAGTASVTTTLTTFQHKPAYHIQAVGKSNSSYDWIFKVRDLYETFIDTVNMQSLKFVRKINEGKYKKEENYIFNHQSKTVYTSDGVYETPECVQDVVSAVFNARNIDYSSYRINDRILFSMFLDNQVYRLYIQYLGKEEIKTHYGKFHAIKLKPLLVKGEIFKDDDKMLLWISDDANHLPLRVESPISVGSVKVDMTAFSNLRYPLSSEIK